MKKSKASIDYCHAVSDADKDIICKKVFLSSETGLVLLDSKCCVDRWNPWFTKYCGIDINEVVGKKLLEIFPVLEKSSIERAVNASINNGMSSIISQTLNRNPFPLKHSSGQFLEQQIIVKPITLENHEHFCLIQITDVTAAVNREKQLVEQAKTTRAFSRKLAREKERAQITLAAIADAVITTDKVGAILSMNPVAEILTGVFEDEALGKNVDQVFKLINEETQEPILCPVTQCLDRKDVVVNDVNHMLQGVETLFSITDSVAPIFDEDENMLGTILVFRDVSQSRALSAELNWQALHDPLTGLANRRKFEAEMKKLLIKARSDDLKHHLLYLDLDQFKVVNDTCGHDAGDELLKQITDILDKKTRKTDLLARLGGDEFGLLLESCDAEHALVIANNLRQAVEDFRFGWQTQSFKIGVSIGITEITGTESKDSEILSAADAACYVAKESGRNRVHFHQINSSASAVHQKEMQWISRLQAALDNDNFELYLQRIQDAETLSVASNHYEILLRMIGEDGEIIPPGAFLPAAERFNLIGSIDRWVIENVFKKIKNIKKSEENTDNLTLSINLSGVSMGDTELLDRICQLLSESSFPAENFCFEITETAAIANLKHAQVFLTTLRSKGCKIALDDFGSGLSSFAYLKSLPVDVIKIDGYFVKDIADDDVDKVFVESINKMSQVMGLTTVAEFVENESILKVLTEIGVNYAQGFGIHKPCPFDEAIIIK
ncbi:MAG: EAL domain-containing protein [Methylococcaceae bacterium]|nr:EAL domain-containing protein [Methylococcaceae bacterium]